MPERLDHVRVSTRSGAVEIPWTTRDALLDEFRNVQRAFQAVGASRPVDLDPQGKRLLLAAIDGIGDREGGADARDPQLVRLRHRLAEDLTG